MWYDRDRRLVAFEDKLAVKELGRRADVPVVPTLGLFEPASLDPEHDPALQLPRFVLKTNHGYNDVVLVERLEQGCRLGGRSLRGEAVPWSEARSALREHFSQRLRRVHSQAEWAVTRIGPRSLFAEPWLARTDDYKVWVVMGRALFVFAFTNRWGAEGTLAGAFDRDWSLLGAQSQTLAAYGEAAERLLQRSFPRPPGLERLLAYSESLVPADMPVMRADFYPTEGGDFVLGECTSYPNAGCPTFEPDVELRLGRLIRQRWLEAPPSWNARRRGEAQPSAEGRARKSA
jgi:hypothetical protein